MFSVCWHKYIDKTIKSYTNNWQIKENAKSINSLWTKVMYLIVQFCRVCLSALMYYIRGFDKVTICVTNGNSFQELTFRLKRMTDIQIFLNEYLNWKFLFIFAPQQNFHPALQCVIHTIEFLTAAIQGRCRGPFESNILLCVTSNFFLLRNHNFFTHLVVFLTGNQLCLSFWLGWNLVFQVTGLNSGNKIFMRDLRGEFTSQCRVFLSICQHMRSVSCSLVRGKIMAAALPPTYYTLSASDLHVRPPKHSDFWLSS